MLLALTKIVKSYIHKGGQAKKDAQVFFATLSLQQGANPWAQAGILYVTVRVSYAGK